MQREERLENLYLSTQSMIRGWRSHFQKVLGPENLSPTLMTMLFHISANQPVSGRNIGSALQLSPSAVSQLIDGLDQLGYVTRRSDLKDRRVTHFGLTPVGEEKVVDLENKRQAYFHSITATLSDEEIDTMVSIQQKLIDEIKNPRIESENDKENKVAA